VNSDQNNANASADQNAQAGAQDQSKQGEKLPQTASPLPLISLLGFGSMLTGLATRRRK
jgi:LPXTG-motif cell wall-anchored protein